MDKNELKQLLQENLFIDISVIGSSCSCCDGQRLKIQIRFEDETLCSDAYPLSLLKSEMQNEE